LPTAAGVVRVAPWPISIGPITPPATFNQGELGPLRPDRPVVAMPTASLERQLKAALMALAGVLAGWGAWWAWRNAREAHRLPFARAWRQLRRLDPGDRQAWLALHQALNATAGRVVHGRTLGRLLAEAPHLQPVAAPLEAFFRHSEQRFFATAAAAELPALDLRALGLALRDAERRHHA
jgi:mxaA protein